MSESVEISFEEDLLLRAETRAAELGLTPAEYIEGLVRRDLGLLARPAGLEEDGKPFDISEMFDLITDGPETDIAKDKDKLIGEAVWEEYLNETGRKPQRR